MSTVTAIANEFNDARKLIADLAVKMGVINDVGNNAYGYTSRLKPEDRFLETNTPNVLVDKVSEPIMMKDGLVERLGDELVTNGDFSDGADGWNLGTGWSLQGSKVKHSGGFSNLVPTATQGLVSSKVYRVQVSVTKDVIGGSVFLYWNGTSDNVAIKTDNGLFEYVLTGADGFIQFGTALDGVALDNISIKELQQAELPAAPFDPSSTDALHDDSVHSLTLQQSVSKGDIVVTGNIVREGVQDSAGSTPYVELSDTSSLEIGMEVNVFKDDGSLVVKDVIVHIGVNSFIQFGNTYVREAVNYTVKPSYSDKYQATRDTADMNDVDDTYTGFVDDGNVVLFTGTGTGGVVNHYYKNVSGVTKQPSTTDFSITANWQDLGTAENMSLENPYFQKLDQVTRQDVVLYRIHKNTKAHGYYTFKGTKYFGADYSQYDVMTAYGYTQVDKNLWEDTDYYYVFVMLRSTLNAGAYHPVLNEKGTSMVAHATNPASIQYWYSTTAYNLVSTYDTFIKNINGNGDRSTGGVGDEALFGRPDEALYDKIYLENHGGIIPSGGNLPYAGNTSDSDLLEEESQKLISGSGLEEGVETLYASASFNPLANNSFGNLSFLSVAGYNLDNLPTDTNVGGYEIKILCVNKGTSTNWVTGKVYTSSVLRKDSIGSYFIMGQIDGSLPTDVKADMSLILSVVRKQSYLTTYKSSTTLDLIGDPNNYPSDWKAHLASGKGIVGNALLVGQDGTSYVDIDFVGNAIMSKKALGSYDYIRTNDNGVTYTSNTTNSDGVTNTNDLNLSTGTGWIYLLPYKSANAPLVQSDPLKVLKVQPKAYASNSHSVYKGSLVTYIATGGKVATGSSDGGFESRLLENGEVLHNYSELLKTSIQEFPIGTVFYIEDTSFSTRTIIDSNFPVKGTYYEYSNDDGSTALLEAQGFGYAIRFTNLGTSAQRYDIKLGSGGINTAPSHNPLSLNADNTPASKWFTTLAIDEKGEKVLQVFSEEKTWDVGADSPSDMTAIDGTTPQSYTAGVRYKILNVDNEPVVEWKTTSTGITFNLLNQTDKGFVGNTSNILYATRWDGDGFGDSKKFEQLTNGTMTDANGNKVQTKVLTKRLGVWDD